MRTQVRIGLIIVLFVQISYCTFKRPVKLFKSPWYLLTNTIHPSYEVCNTDICWKDVQHYDYSFDMKINPCDDFYNFVCGGWLLKEKIPESEAVWDAFTYAQHEVNNALIHILKEPLNYDEPGPVKAAKTFFRECINTEKLELEGLNPLNSLLTQYGGWPIIQSDWSSNFNLAYYTAHMYKQFGLNPFFNIALYPDLKNLSHLSITINEPSTILPKELLMEPDKHEKEIMAYAKWIQKIAMQLSDGEIPFENLKSDAFKIVKLEISLTKLLTNIPDTDDFSEIYNRKSIHELQHLTDGFPSTFKMNWLQFFQEIFRDSNIQITPDRVVIINNLEYLQNVFELISATPTRILSNFLVWHLVRVLSTETTADMRTFSHDIDKIIFGIKKGYSRDEECKQLIEQYIPHVLSFLYLKRNFNKDIKNQVKNQEISSMTIFIRNALEETMRNSEWMDATTKLKAIEKIQSMNLEIGFMRNLDQQKHLENAYQNLQMSENHFKNTIDLSTYSFKQMLSKLDDAILETDVPVGPTVVNAFNHRNTIYNDLFGNHLWHICIISFMKYVSNSDLKHN